MIWFILAVAFAIGISVWFQVHPDPTDDGPIFLPVLATALFVAFFINLMVGIFVPSHRIDYHHKIQSLSVDTIDGYRSFVYRDSKGLHTDSINSSVVKNAPELSMTETDFVVFNGWLSVMNFEDNATTFNVPKGFNINLSE